MSDGGEGGVSAGEGGAVRDEEEEAGFDVLILTKDGAVADSSLEDAIGLSGAIGALADMRDAARRYMLSFSKKGVDADE